MSQSGRQQGRLLTSLLFGRTPGKCSGERLGRQRLGVKGSDNGQLIHDDDDDVHVPGQSRGKRAAACVKTAAASAVVLRLQL